MVYFISLKFEGYAGPLRVRVGNNSINSILWLGALDPLQYFYPNGYPLFLTLVGAASMSLQTLPLLLLLLGSALLWEQLQIDLFRSACVPQGYDQPLLPRSPQPSQLRSLSLDNESVAQATADANGLWRAMLPAQPASTGHTLQFTAAGSTITLDDIAFGDVFLCAGMAPVLNSIIRVLTASI